MNVKHVANHFLEDIIVRPSKTRDDTVRKLGLKVTEFYIIQHKEVL